MKKNLKTLLPVAALFLAPLVPAASVTLLDFNAFESPDTYFLGDWELNGDGGGTNLARSTFLQGSGAFAFDGGLNDASASTFTFLTTPIDITGLTLLDLSASQLANNTAATFTISLFDANSVGAYASFSTADFGAGFTSVTAALTFDFGFDTSQVSSIQISGGIVGGTDVLSVSLDNLAATTPSTPPAGVPDTASTFSLMLLAFVGVAVIRRRFSWRLA